MIASNAEKTINKYIDTVSKQIGAEVEGNCTKSKLESLESFLDHHVRFDMMDEDSLIQNQAIVRAYKSILIYS